MRRFINKFFLFNFIYLLESVFFFLEEFNAPYDSIMACEQMVRKNIRKLKWRCVSYSVFGLENITIFLSSVRIYSNTSTVFLEMV